MARPTTVAFNQFLIEVGDGASPETFAAPCGLTSKGFNQSASTQDTTVPDCDDPDAPAYVERAVDALSAEISGSGVLAMEAFTDVWEPWYRSALFRNAHVRLDVPAADGGGYYTGKFILSQFNMTGQRGQKVNVEVTMVSDGEITWVPA